MSDWYNLGQMDFEGAGDGDWVSAFKAEAGRWAGPPLVVLSLFDGLGGIWQALTNLGIPFSGYSSEVVSIGCSLHFIALGKASSKYHKQELRYLVLRV